MNNWQKYIDNPDELVLSSRIRIARNMRNIPFPHKLDEEHAREVVNSVEKAFYISDHIQNEYKTFYLWQSDNVENNVYLEKHLISPGLLNNKDKAAFILKEDETVSIMINEEDHIRLQCINGGFNLEDCYNIANKLDNLLEENVDYAFEEKLGYITACPTNLGTGLRASVMIHLPALTMNNEINGILKVLTQVGMTIRGLYGEGSKSEGNLYQISNQVTLGISEEDVISNLQTVISQIIEQENRTRINLFDNYQYEIKDKIFRSKGILENAMLLNSSECMELLSNVRMGIEMDIIKDVDKTLLNDLLINIQPASLLKRFNTRFTETERNIHRAEIVRNAFRTYK